MRKNEEDYDEEREVDNERPFTIEENIDEDDVYEETPFPTEEEIEDKNEVGDDEDTVSNRRRNG